MAEFQGLGNKTPAVQGVDAAFCSSAKKVTGVIGVSYDVSW
jgi:hypothetical protein